jgi:hypothetical protein
MSVMPLKTDIPQRGLHVRLVPLADAVAASFGHRHFKSKRAPPCEDARLVTSPRPWDLVARVPARRRFELVHNLSGHSSVRWDARKVPEADILQASNEDDEWYARALAVCSSFN